MKNAAKKIMIILAAAQTLLYASGRKDSAAADGQRAGAAYEQRLPEGSPVDFRETWGYVMQKYEAEFDPDFPITDVGYFAAEVDCYGDLVSVPNRLLLGDYGGRVHLVAICDSRSLTHFVLEPQSAARQKLMRQLLDASRNFDGLQIDFELIPARDRGNFLSFLRELKKSAAAENKIFSVCVPARTKTISDDVFPYKEITAIADRVIVMAYDEHWSSSAPGPIASMDWSQKIADYAVTVIPPEKLVMGLPFYGRTWADKKTAAGWYFSGINRIMRENKIRKIGYDEEIPTVTIDMNVTLTGWFEDAYSLVHRLRLYKASDIQSVAFWRVGQEDPTFWQWLTVSELSGGQ